MLEESHETSGEVSYCQASALEMTAEVAGPCLVSVVIPCLNESETVASCIREALEGIARARIVGEVLVADNGSTDGSPEIARTAGARVVTVMEKGYGSALAGGIQSARGTFVIMGDADGSYNFLDIPKIVAQLQEGATLSIGCRLSGGGGTVLPRAMPFLHRWIGNPLFSFLVRGMFRAPIHDVYCGLRGFRRDCIELLDLRCSGMEFAVEMVIKVALNGEPIREFPTTLRPDGRISTKPHLKTFRDGWRTLRFFLMASPTWLFLRPGQALTGLGAGAMVLGWFEVHILGLGFSSHTLLLGGLLFLLGWQSVVFSICAARYAYTTGFLPVPKNGSGSNSLMSFEWILSLGVFLFLSGVVLTLLCVYRWYLTDFGVLQYPETMRVLIPAVLLCFFGGNTIYTSFLLSLFDIAKQSSPRPQLKGEQELHPLIEDKKAIQK